MSLSAAPERDAAFRDRGRIVAMTLQRITRGMLSDDDAMRQLIAHGIVRTSITLPTTLMAGVGLPELVIPIAIGPLKRGTAAAFVPTKQGVGYIILPILPHGNWLSIMARQHHRDEDVRLDAQDTIANAQAFVDDWFNQHQSFIVHEMTHMFDWLRRKGARIPIFSESSRSAYLNSPLETNAFFQEMLTQLQELLVGLPDEAQDNFDTYATLTRRTRAYKESWEHLTLQNKRKLLSRLYQTWEHRCRELGRHPCEGRCEEKPCAPKLP